MDKAFSNFTWYNEPDIRSPLAAAFLNLINTALNTVDDRVVAMDTSKADQADLQQSLKSVSYNATTGVWTFEKWNGSTQTFDQNIEKIPVSFSMSENGIITMTNTDGTSYTANLKDLILRYTFTDSSTIDFTTYTLYDSDNPYVTYFNGEVTDSNVDITGLDTLPGIIRIEPVDESNTLNITSIVIRYRTSTESKVATVTPAADTTSYVLNVYSSLSAATKITEIYVVFSGSGVSYKITGHKTTGVRTTADIIDGSITDSKLQPNYLSDITTQANNASQSASSASTSASDAHYDRQLAQSYAIGGSGIRDGEDVDNAKYYKEQAAAIVGTTGHIIQDSTPTTYTPRTNLRFISCTVTDDSTNDATLVTPQLSISQTEWTQIENILA